MIEAILKVLVLPPASLLLLYGAGLLAGRRWQRAGAWLRHGAVAVLFILSTGAGAWLLARPLEALEAPMARVPPAAQAIVVLTAGRIKHNPEYGSAAMPDFVALGRMTYAARLAHASGLPLLVTGGTLSKAPDDEPLAFGMRRVFLEASPCQCAGPRPFRARPLKTPAFLRPSCNATACATSCSSPMPCTCAAPVASSSRPACK